MTARKVAIITGVVGTFIILMGVVAYEVVLPEIIAKRYIAELHSSAQRLRTDFENLSGGTDTPLLNNPGVPIEERKFGAEMLKKTLSDSKNHLAELQIKTQSLHTLPYSGYTSTYGQAVALQERSERVILQATDVLNEFSSTITFLESYTSTIDATQAAIDQFNQTTDLSVLTSQSATQRQIASQIRQDADTLQNTATPKDFEAVKIATIRTLQQAADGFDELAGGLELGAEAQIDQAALKIETAGQQLASTDSSSYIGIADQSRSIRSVHELNEKLDLILP